MKRLNMFLPEIMLTKLTELSDSTGLCVSEHIRRAIDLYLDMLKSKAKNEGV